MEKGAAPTGGHRSILLYETTDPRNYLIVTFEVVRSGRYGVESMEKGAVKTGGDRSILLYETTAPTPYL